MAELEECAQAKLDLDGSDIFSALIKTLDNCFLVPPQSFLRPRLG